jgi:membrane-associated phospholipid phosphatase
MKKQTVLLFLLAAFAIKTTAQNIDINILKGINKNETAFKNTYFNTTADLVTPLSFAVPAAIAATGFITKNNLLKKDAVFIAGTYIGSALVTYSIKHIAKRQRPYQKYSFIAQRIDADNDLSFPSGHTSAAFATATSVALRYKKWYFVAPAYIFAGSVAWARMYQGVHYPSDVLTGALIGAGSAWLGYKVQERWFTKKKKIVAPITLN